MIAFAEPTEWWLEVSPSIHETARQTSQQFSTPHSQHVAYLNEVCLQSVLTWLREEIPEATSWLPAAEQPAIWDVVTGVKILAGTTQLVVIPSEAIDDAELAMPQEWVDIPDWVADYYLVAQIQPDGEWMRIWGYTTHQDLKTIADYDPSDRTYCLAAEQLTRDLNAFWVTVQLCSTAQTRAAVAPFAELSPAQAETLIQRLADPAILWPRLAVPFEFWGALLEQKTWRHQLFLQRTGGRAATNRVERLSEWWQGQFAAVWQAVEAVILPQQLTTAWRSEASAQPGEAVSRAKVLEFGAQPGERSVALVLGVTAVADASASIRLQVCPTGNHRLLPNPVQVRLLDAEGNEVGQASAAITETIQLEFAVDLGERFQVEVRCGDQRITEAFEL